MKRRPWTQADIATVRRRYPHEPTKHVAEALGRPVHSIYTMAQKLGLHKTPEYFQRHKAGRLDGVKGTLSRFKPGNTPWNKGTHYVAGGRSAETRFKPGGKPQDAHNYVPVGTVRIHNIGARDYLEKKFTDDTRLYPAARWKPVHRLVWEAAYGPVPPGLLVAFKPGMKTLIEHEITLDRLELIDRRELMRRNSVQNLPKPLAELVQLRGALNRKIRNREKKAHEQDDQRSA